MGFTALNPSYADCFMESFDDEDQLPRVLSSNCFT
jgi:hypothetical protein